MPKIVSRKEAKERGLKRYFSGIPCRHGHISERYVSSRGCVDCNHNVREYDDEKENIEARNALDSELHKEWLVMPVIAREARKKGELHYFTGKKCHKGHIAPRRTSGFNCIECEKEYQAENEEKIKQIKRDYVERNKELHNARGREWDRKNPEYSKQYSREYHKRFPHKSRINANKRRYRELNATPQWFSNNDVDYIYYIAKSIGFNVDHIIPIKNDTVCGLNVRENLGLLTEVENKSKGNKFNQDNIGNAVPDCFLIADLVFRYEMTEAGKAYGYHA